MTIKPWETLSSETKLSDSFLTLRTDRCQKADGAIVPTYHVLEFTEWVTVCVLYTSPNPRDRTSTRMPSSA